MPQQPESLPRFLLVGAAALMASSIALAGLSRVTQSGALKAQDSQVVESALMVFKDEADGGVGVYAYESGAPIRIFERDTGGFVRTAIRAAAHERKITGGSAQAPFRLDRTANGRLILTDTITGRAVSLEAFGDANSEDFARLLTGEGADDGA
jgi:putative photosynthetic complex assembly protein